MKHLASTAFGLMMVAVAVGQAVGQAGVRADTPAMALAPLTVAAVLAGIRFRPLATVAVLLTVSMLALAAAPPLFAALAGLVATAYLVLRHGADAGAASATPQTMAAAAGFTAVVVTAMVLPVGVPWLPLVAPLAVVVCFAIAVVPFWASGGNR